MCGRYSEHVNKMRGWADVLQEWAEYERERRNVAPTQMVGVINADGVKSMRWGLVPQWSKTPTTRYATFNARLEDVASKAAYRSAWKHGRRCLLPAGGYYEWKSEDGAKQPYFVHREDDGPVVFAGLWEHWCDRDSGESVLSCTLLTKAPSANMARLHHRMPVILGPGNAASWLHGSVEDGAKIAEATDGDGLVFHPVSRRVNSGRVEGADLTEPL